MRADGTVTYFRVQAVLAVNPEEPRWSDVAVDALLFEGIGRDEARGELGRRYKALLEPQSASSDLWQCYGIHGFEHKEDVLALYEALRERRPDYDFRVVKRTQSQRTLVVAGMVSKRVTA